MGGFGAIGDHTTVGDDSEYSSRKELNAMSTFSLLALAFDANAIHCILVGCRVATHTDWKFRQT